MKRIATFLILLIIGEAYSLAAPKNATASVSAAPKNSTDSVLVSPGVSISKGFKKANCLASKFGVLCASGTIDGCVTKDSKTKCGKQCICGPSDCSCGTSGCYCQVNAGCRCNGSK